MALPNAARTAAGLAALSLLCGIMAADATSFKARERMFPENDVEFEYASRGWINTGPAGPDDVLQVSFALKSRDAAALQSHMEAVSDPFSPRYGMYLTQQQITRHAAAPPEAVATIVSFLLQHVGQQGARTWMNVHRDILHAEVPASSSQALFGVTMHHFASAADPAGVSYLRALEHYSVPAEVGAFIDFVGGLNRLPDLTRPGVASALTHHGASASAARRSAAAPSALPTGNSAQTLQSFGGASQTVFVMPRCASGKPFTTWNSGCASGSNGTVGSLKVTVVPDDATLAGTKATFTAAQAAPHCQACSKYEGQPDFGNSLYQICNATGRSYGLSNSDAVVWCALPVDDCVVAAKSTVTTDVTFASGAAASGPGAALSVFVEPLVTPSFIRNLYQVGSAGTGTTSHAGSQSVAEFLKQYYSPTDLEAYKSHFGLSTTPVTVVGTNNPKAPGGEASLDIQVIQGVAPNVPTSFWSTSGLRNTSLPAGPSNQEPFYRWITAVLDATSPPLVHSSSYSDREAVMPRKFTDNLNLQFVKAALRGLTLLFATGDDGAAGIICRSGNCSSFNPTFPPTSPTVTSVGGTQMARPIPGQAPLEVVADSATGSFITSGGAFSNRYAMPAYQAYDVKQYLAHAKPLPPASLFNASGRAYPDISAISTNFLIYLGGSQMPIGGTSASTPTTAAIFSMLNEARLANGFAPLGFLNPLLYALNTSPIPYFNDVQSGNNKCSALPTHCAKYGFYAWYGWDACTGLGTPVFNLLASGVMPSRGTFKPAITENTPFVVSSVNMFAASGIWGPDVETVVRITGSATKKVTAGDIAFKIYESGVTNSVGGNATAYFECNSHGCDPNDPVALRLEHPDKIPTNFTAQFSFRMPPKSDTGCFQLVAHGKDQAKDDDFIVTIGYNFTSFA